MIQSGYSLFLALCLTVCCWLGLAAPLAASPRSLLSASVASSSPALTSPTLDVAMASKPLFSFSGTRPTNLGIKDGKFAPCPNTPNCVSSQAAETDTEHKIAPIVYTADPAEVMARLKSIIEGMERTKIVTASDDYLYAEFTSALMGFVDDVEFYFDPSTPGFLQVRSASRLGQSDLGVNRKRVEEIRSKLAQFD